MTSAGKTCTIIGSNKGGVGKSLIALTMTMIYDNAGQPLKVVEIDNERKLSSSLGSRVNLSIDAFVKISESMRNRHAPESYYNDVYQEISSCDSVIDFGANVTNPFFEWFKQCEMGYFAAEDKITFRFVACAIPDQQAVAAAISAVDTARDALGPTAEYYVVLNDITGQSGFAPYEANPQYMRLLEMEAKGEITILRIGYCDSLLFEHGKAMHMTPLETVGKAEEVAARAGLDTISTRVHKLKLMRWLQATQVALDPLLMVYQVDAGEARQAG